MTEAQLDAPTDQTPRFSALDAVGLFTRGLAMGAADVVPGVSGGTIAFISGIYERFVAALGSLSPVFLIELCRGRVREALRRFFMMHWGVLIPLLGGIALSIVLLSKLITGLMDSHPGPTYGFFFGLIAASAWVPLAMMTRFKAHHAAALALAAVAAWVFVGLRAGPIQLQVARAEEGARSFVYAGKIRSTLDLAVVAGAAEVHLKGPASFTPELVVFDPKGVLSKHSAEAPAGFELRVLGTKRALESWNADRPAVVVLEEQRASLGWIFACGAVAISAMILPGISGSFLLLFLGQYHAVFSAIHQCIGHVLGLLGRQPDTMTALVAHPWWRDFLFVGVFLMGVVIGMALFSRAVTWLFRHAHDITMAVLTGVMIGALRQPGREILDDAQRTGGGSSYWVLVAATVVVGAVLVTGMNIADRVIRARRAAP